MSGSVGVGIEAGAASAVAPARVGPSSPPVGSAPSGASDPGLGGLPTFATAEQMLRACVESDLAEFDAPLLLQLLAALDNHVRIAESVRAKVLAAVEKTEAWRTDGTDPSLAAWRARKSRAGTGVAHSQVRTARTLDQVPEVAQAVESGEMTMEHAEALARVVSSGGTARKESLAQELAKPGEAGKLVETAKKVDAGRFAKSAETWAAGVDKMSTQQDHNAQREARYLTIADFPGGTKIDGRLDSMAGHRVRLALEALTGVPAADDMRDPGQRAADALDAMASGVLADPATTPGAHVPPQVSIIMTEETVAGLREMEQRRRAEFTGEAFGLPESDTEMQSGGQAQSSQQPQCATRPFEPALLEDGSPVPVSETARILCDCQLTRIVVGADSVPLDLGRAQRLWTKEHRRLIIARDRSCFWDGCTMPARYCEIHHIEWWERDNGRTDVVNAVLGCAFHHGLIHTHDLDVVRRVLAPEERIPGGPEVAYTVKEFSGRVVSGPGASPPSWALVPDNPFGGDWAIGRSRRPVDVCGAAGAESAHSPPDRARKSDSRREVSTSGDGGGESSSSGSGREPPDPGQPCLFDGLPGVDAA